MNKRIFLSFPHLGGYEMKYIEEAFKESWVVPLGPNVDMFEQRLGDYLGEGHVVALSAGTAAIHIGLVMLGVGQGDEVLCQSFTFSASANPVMYQGAKPVFVDSEPDTWNMSPDALEEAIIDRHRVTGCYPKAIVVVHLYGMPAKMDEIMRYGALSFNGNKVITTSGGGALICPTADAAARVKFLVTQAREKVPYYYHKVIGYNYRLSNVSAGIGCGQMEVLADRVERRREIHGLYAKLLGDIPEVRVHGNPSADVNSNFWLTTILFDERLGFTPEDLRQYLDANNIESRWLWRPMNMQPVYADAPFYGDGTAERLFGHGLCLPSGSILTDDEIAAVADAVRTFVKSKY